MKAPNDYDKLVAGRLRQARIERCLSQEKLGDVIGVAPQQVQKYEGGINRISAGRLALAAAALKFPIAYFYQDI